MFLFQKNADLPISIFVLYFSWIFGCFGWHALAIMQVQIKLFVVNTSKIYRYRYRYRYHFYIAIPINIHTSMHRRMSGTEITTEIVVLTSHLSPVVRHHTCLCALRLLDRINSLNFALFQPRKGIGFTRITFILAEGIS